jgi:hypothetical protein
MSTPARPHHDLLPAEEEEAVGIPSFEMLVRDGQPVVSGSYFLHPPLRAVEAHWNQQDPSRLEVRADDGSDWYATGVPSEGRVSVALQPVDPNHPALTKAHAVVHLAGDTELD